MTGLPALKERERTQEEWNRKVKDGFNAMRRRVMLGGTTAERPSDPTNGQMYYDDDLGRPVWWNRIAGMWRGGPPRKTVTKTANFSQAVTEWTIFNNKPGSSLTVTLLSAVTYQDETVRIMNMQAQTVVSASSNVCPIGSATPGAAILPATIGAWCVLQSDGTYWRVVARGT